MQVQVRLCAGHVEIYLDNSLIAKHKAEYSSGRIIWLAGQYSGLSEKGGVPVPHSLAQQTQAQVEVRSLSEYEQIFEVLS